MSEKKNYFNNTKVANLIQRFDDLTKDYNISELGEKHKDVTSYIVFPSNGIQDLNYSLNRFDLAVMDAIYTIYQRGKEGFTLEMVADTIFGKEIKYRKDATSKLDQISASIDKLATIRVQIDFNQVMMTLDPSLRNGRESDEKADRYIIKDNLLHIREIRKVSQVKKEEKVWYVLGCKPILHEYAEKLGRIISVPTHILSISGIREDIDFALVKQEIIKEIEIMKNKNNNYVSRSISYEWEHGEKKGGLLYRLGINKNQYKNDVQWRKRKSRLNEQVRTVLDHLVEVGYITGYRFNHSGKSTTGVEIDL